MSTAPADLTQAATLRAWAASCALIGAAMTYVWSDFGAWPRLWFAPYAGTWHWGVPHGDGVAMSYYGTLVWGVVGGLGGTCLATGWRALQPAWRPALARWITWAIAAAVFAAGYFAWNIWPF